MMRSTTISMFSSSGKQCEAGTYQDQTAPQLSRLDTAIERAIAVLLAEQQQDGHWINDLESDASFPADYVLLVHYLGEQPNLELEQKIARYLRRTQLPDGGWPLSTDGPFNINTSVRAYFALKMIGDSVDADHMRSARYAILSHGGIEAVNVFTRIQLALYSMIIWRAVPTMPVEIMLLPKWFPFHLSKVSYWARTVIVPLLVLNVKRPVARNPRGVRIDELFCDASVMIGLPPRASHQSKGWFYFFRLIDAILRTIDSFFPKYIRQRAIETAVAFVNERLNGEDGFGAIFPAMAYVLMMYDALGYSADHPNRVIARHALEKLLVIHDDEAYCQSSLSPVWDTAFTVRALLETGDPCAEEAALRGLQWLRPRQILDVRGDWISRRPSVRPGGWAFQYKNPYYPDVDDTAMVVMAMHRAAALMQSNVDREAIARAREWVVGMQSNNGGWGAYEPENTQHYLNNIPFADHGGLIDSPTTDITARCLLMLTQLGEVPEKSDPARRAFDYLLKEQKADGSWYGHWGMNYIYGTWIALCALNAVGMTHDASQIKRAVQWLMSIQNDDGGWGEGVMSYKLDYHGYEHAPSTISQTAWALLGLMEADAVKHPAIVNGIKYLLRMQTEQGTWQENYFTGTGVPRMCYLRYHGYCKIFPLWALAQYRWLVK